MRAMSHLRVAIALLSLGCGSSGSSSQTADAGANDATSSCNDNGAIHPSGTTWKCSDGCNSCSCDNGMTSTTTIFCGAVDAGGDGGADASKDTGADALTESGTCVEVPTLDANDLSCDSDEDCTSVWSGTICSCGCSYICGPSAPGNTAASARVASALSSVPTCSEPPGCGCPASGLPRCSAHQCILCYDMPNQPAACDEDAGDGGD
jgi:hypothetical protein